MRIQLVNMAGYKPVFRNNGSCDDSKPATVGDLRAMGQRIINHIDANYKNQNKMIGDAFYNLCDLVYFRDIPSSGDSLNSAQNSAKVLMNNGQPVKTQTYHFSDDNEADAD